VTAAARFNHVSGERGGERMLHVIQGEYASSAEAEVVLTTILGSCVAACFYDAEAGVGGMNHFLLPEGDGDRENVRYGVNAMELLINDLLHRGARRNRLEAKIFGGARLLNGVTDIGARNVAFAQDFLSAEGIAHRGGSLGGDQARRIRFWPATGAAKQLLLARKEDVFATESRAVRHAPAEDGGAVELF
jgi:chemotaxis protein CheD